MAGHEIRLVDEIGGLTDAVKAAAKLAGLDKYSVRELPVIEDPFTRIISQFGGEMKMNILKNEMGESAKYFNIVEEIRNLSGIQARLPYFLEIR